MYHSKILIKHPHLKTIFHSNVELYTHGLLSNKKPSTAPSETEYKQILELVEEDIMNRIDLFALKLIAELIGEVLPGYWSVDFCKGVDDKWYLIDMAAGKLSWHPNDCQV